MIIPIPTQTDELEEGEKPDSERIRWYLTWPNWLCPVCGTTMTGPSRFCAYCQIRRGVQTPRPSDYREPVYSGSGNPAKS